jgi:hypothetical protein
MSNNIFFARLVPPPNEGDREVYQRYPAMGGFGDKRTSAPYASSGFIRDSEIHVGSSPDCTTGQWYTTLPQDYPRAKVVMGPTTLKHIYGTVCYDDKGKPTVCRTGARQDHESYDYMYQWIPKNTAGYDSSAPLGPSCCPTDIGEPAPPPDRTATGSCRHSDPSIYRLGQYRNPEEPFRTAGTLLWPANGRDVREPHLYTMYDWTDGKHHPLHTNVHPRMDMMSPPIYRY